MAFPMPGPVPGSQLSYVAVTSDDGKARFEQRAVNPVGGISEELARRLATGPEIWKEVAMNANL